MKQGHHEAIIATVDREAFSKVADGQREADVRFSANAQPGDTVILEEVDPQGPTGRKVEATLIAVDAPSRGGVRHIEFRPKESKYTPKA